MAKYERVISVRVGRPHPRGLAAVVVCVLGSVSVGWDCGASTAGGIAAEPDADAGAPRIEASTADGAQHRQDASDTVVGPPPDSGFGDAGTGIPTTGGSSATFEGGACVVDYAPCGDAATCCHLACAMGACGGTLAEGEPCMYTGMTPPAGAPACGDGLACNGGFCGTNACVPDGMPCGGDAGAVCCNDDCDGTVCKS